MRRLLAAMVGGLILIGGGLAWAHRNRANPLAGVSTHPSCSPPSAQLVQYTTPPAEQGPVVSFQRAQRAVPFTLIRPEDQLASDATMAIHWNGQLATIDYPSGITVTVAGSYASRNLFDLLGSEVQSLGPPAHLGAVGGMPVMIVPNCVGRVGHPGRVSLVANTESVAVYGNYPAADLLRVAGSAFGQTWGGGDRCPRTTDPLVPPGSGCISVARADFNANGTLDEFIIYANPLDADRYPLAWHVAWSNGGGPLALIHSPRHRGAAVYPKVLAVADANGDGRPDVFAYDPTKSESYGFSIYTLAGSEWTRVHLPDGRPLQIEVAGSNFVQTGGWCAGGSRSSRIVVAAARSRTQQRWRVTELVYRFTSPAGVHLAGTRHVTFDLGSRRGRPHTIDPFVCGSLSIPG